MTNGTGTANTSNTSVKVDSVTNTYAIKGNINGLTGSGLVVQLSVGVTLPIAAGTPTFAFNSVTSGTVFALTILAPPTGQTCLVNTGNGTLGGADVTNISVTCTTPGFTVQRRGSLGGTQGYERGCYTVTGATFTVSLAAACRPNGIPALDGNGTNGFSSKNGAAIAFTITSATTATIDGVQYRRIAPEG